MNAGAISGPINAGRTGAVVKILDKEEPTPDEIADNFDQTRDQLLAESRNQTFSVFMSGIWNDYKKHNLIRFNAKAQEQQGPGNVGSEFFSDSGSPIGVERNRCGQVAFSLKKTPHCSIQRLHRNWRTAVKARSHFGCGFFCVRWQRFFSATPPSQTAIQLQANDRAALPHSAQRLRPRTTPAPPSHSIHPARSTRLRP